MATLLLVGDSASSKDERATLLREHGFEVVLSPDPDQASDLASATGADVVILQARDPSAALAASCKDLCEHAHAVIAVFDQPPGLEAKLALIEAGADLILSEPVDGRELETCCRALARKRITAERLEAERERVQDLERWCCGLVEGAPDIVSRFDRAHRYTFLNTSITRVTGRAREQFLGRTHGELGMAPEEARAWEANLERAFRGDPDVVFDYTLPAQAGKRVFEVRLTPERSAAGEVTSVSAIGRDITEGRRTEAFLETLIETVPVGIAVVEEDDLRHVLANPAYHAFTGSGQPVVGLTMAEVFPGLAEQGLDRIIRRHLRQREPLELRELEVWLRGLPRWWNLWQLPVTTPRGSAGALLIAEDCTDTVLARRRLEDLARTAELELAKLHAVIDSMSDSVSIADVDGNLLLMNPAGLAHHGYPTVETLRADLARAPGIFRFETLDGAAVPRERHPMARALGGESFAEADFRVTNVETGVSWIGRYSGAPVRDSQGTIVLATVTMHDVTAQKQAERLLADRERTVRAQLAEIEALYQSAPIGLCVFDTSLRFVRLNERVAEFDGLPREEHIGLTLRDVVPPMADVKEQVAAHVFATGEAVLDVEVSGETLAEPGVMRTFIESWVPLKDHNGKITGVNVVVREITDQKRLEAALREQAERLAEANRLKDEFLATLSHELRTPLGVIVGWAQMLKSGSVKPALAQRAVEAIARSAEAQSRLVNDVLDVSRIIRGKMRLDLQDIDLGGVIDAAVDGIRPAADARQIVVGIRLPEQPARLYADRERLQQVFWNLLSNAVRYTPAGGRIDVSLRTGQDGYEVAVADTGQGIDRAFLPHLFERFSQADSSANRRYGGLGLGLAIVRHLVELHGGSVMAQSAGPGMGATFTVVLPARRVGGEAPAEAEQPELRAARKQEAPSLANRRMLVVDDQEPTLEMLETVLRSAGADVVVATSADEGMLRLQEGPFHVLVSDIAMPGVDGYEFIRRVRAAGLVLPALALTAYGRAEDRARALAAGYQAHLAKPVLPSELIAGVASLLSDEEQRAGRT